jgi:glycosyltransferase involved in cell wall biosynthesis
MMRVADDLAKKYPHCVVVNKVENVPFATYKKIMEDSDVVIDQIYSYSPGMNALLAMSEGKIVVSGGEQEFYELLGEDKCRPIINTAPTYDSLYKSLEDLVLHPELIGELKRKSREYVIRNHDYMNVAKQMVEIYEKCLAQQSSSLLEY